MGSPQILLRAYQLRIIKNTQVIEWFIFIPIHTYSQFILYMRDDFRRTSFPKYEALNEKAYILGLYWYWILWDVSIVQFRSNLLIDVQFIEDIDQMCMCVDEIDTANKLNRDNNTQFYITTSGDKKNIILLKNYHICNS